MADMLVKLFDLPSPAESERALSGQDIRIVRALAPDRSRIAQFAKTCGGQDYSDEVLSAFANNPVTCYIAVRGKELIGFACFEATARDFFGPMAVSEEYRGRGVGKALLLRSLWSMKEMGYGYAIIGWPTRRAVPFYEKCAGAVMIEDDSLGIYRQMIDP